LLGVSPSGDVAMVPCNMLGKRPGANCLAFGCVDLRFLAKKGAFLTKRMRVIYPTQAKG
jgi:hypothetical protein